MSRRTTIVSDLFTSIPISKKKEVLTKGNNHKHQPEKKHSDTVVISGGESSNEDFSINLTEIKNVLNNLKKYKDTPIKALKDQARADFNNVVSMINILTTNDAFNHIYDIILEVFNDVKQAAPATVGAYFAGCSSIKTDFKGNPACSAVCAGSVAPEPGTPGWESCDKLVLLYDGAGTFTTLNEAKDRKLAYIYISDKTDFNGFTKADITRLSTYGVEKAMVVKYSEDGKSYKETSGEFTDIRQLPKIGDKTGKAVVPPATTNTSSGSGSSGSNPNTNLVIVILVIIIIIALIWLGYSYYNGYL